MPAGAQPARRLRAVDATTGDDYFFAFEALSDGVILRNVDLEVLYLNPAAERMFDGARLLDASGEREPDLPYWRVVEQGHSWEGLEFQTRRGDDVRWITSSARPFCRANGAMGVLATYSDITQWHELRAENRRVRWIADNASDVLMESSPDGIIQWVAPSISHQLGWRPEQLVGRSPETFVHPDDREDRNSVVPALDRGERVSQEMRIRCSDGSYRWLSLTAKAVLDADGNVVARISTGRDAQEQIRAREALARSEEQFRLAMDGAPLGMALVGLDGGFIRVNDMLGKTLGRSREWLLEHRVADVLHPEERDGDLAARNRLLVGKDEHITRERRFCNADGSLVWVSQSIGLLRDASGAPLFYVSHLEDVTEAHDARDELVYRASHDVLTGLLNRQELIDRIQAVFTRTPRTGSLLAVLYCDLDYLKEINDTYGHAAGDGVLKSVADRISSSVRGGDVVARLGGDEFVVVLDGVRSAEDARAVAGKIRETVALPMCVSGSDQMRSVDLSIGIAVAGRGTDPEHTLRLADMALYRAKQDGRDRVVVFESD